MGVYNIFEEINQYIFHNVKIDLVLLVSKRNHYKI